VEWTIYVRKKKVAKIVGRNVERMKRKRGIFTFLSFYYCKRFQNIFFDNLNLLWRYSVCRKIKTYHSFEGAYRFSWRVLQYKRWATGLLDVANYRLAGCNIPEDKYSSLSQRRPQISQLFNHKQTRTHVHKPQNDANGNRDTNCETILTSSSI
jgi:hypothetical protein